MIGDRPAPAGWTVAGAEPTGPAPCVGSGQRSLLLAGPSTHARCPECRRTFATDPYSGELPTHYPDPDGARPINLWEA